MQSRDTLFAQKDRVIKLTIIGSSQNKATLRRKFTNCHRPDFITTGIDFTSRTLLMGEERVTVQVWDTAGQEAFRNITHAYFKNTAGYIIAFDDNDSQSLVASTDWLKQIKDYDAKAKILLISIKHKKPVVARVQIEKTAADFNVKYQLVDLEDQQNVDRTLFALLDDIKCSLDDRDRIPSPPSI